jgi:hypothetical protein
MDLTQVTQQSVTKLIPVTMVTLVTPKAGAKHELLFNKPTSGLLNKSSKLGATLGVIKLMAIIITHSVTLCCAA